MPLYLFPNHGCVFTRIGKTASSSLIRGLFGGPKQAAQILWDDTFPEAWRGLFTFGFVRNPFDRLASCLLHFQSYKIANDAEAAVRSRLDLNLIMDVIEDDSISYYDRGFVGSLRYHALPLTHRAHHLDHATFIGRFENFETDYRVIADRLGIDVSKILHARRRERAGYPDYYDATTRARAEAIYARDMAEFGYRFEQD